MDPRKGFKMYTIEVFESRIGGSVSYYVITSTIPYHTIQTILCRWEPCGNHKGPIYIYITILVQNWRCYALGSS